eukprot:3620675-Amphidinium_carterae.1
MCHQEHKSNPEFSGSQRIGMTVLRCQKVFLYSTTGNFRDVVLHGFGRMGRSKEATPQLGQVTPLV